MAPIWYLLEPQMVDLKKYLQDEIDKCNLPNRLIEVQAIKAQKHFWVRGKEDRGAVSDVYGFDYYISRNKDDNQVPHLIRTMRGYTGGVCRLEFEPKRARLQVPTVNSLCDVTQSKLMNNRATRMNMLPNT